MPSIRCRRLNSALRNSPPLAVFSCSHRRCSAAPFDRGVRWSSRLVAPGAKNSLRQVKTVLIDGERLFGEKHTANKASTETAKLPRIAFHGPRKPLILFCCSEQRVFGLAVFHSHCQKAHFYSAVAPALRIRREQHFLRPTDDLRHHAPPKWPQCRIAWMALLAVVGAQQLATLSAFPQRTHKV